MPWKQLFEASRGISDKEHLHAEERLTVPAALSWSREVDMMMIVGMTVGYLEMG